MISNNSRTRKFEKFEGNIITNFKKTTKVGLGCRVKIERSTEFLDFVIRPKAYLQDRKG